MSPQHDWLKSLEPGPEAGADAEGTGVVKGGEASVEETRVEEARAEDAAGRDAAGGDAAGGDAGSGDAAGGDAGSGEAGGGDAGSGEAGGGEAGAERANAESAHVAQADGALVEAGVGAGESADGGSPSVEGDSVGETSSVGEADQPAEAESLAEAEPLPEAESLPEADGAADGLPDRVESPAGVVAEERDRSRWSGRAVGPLSGLLPGAVELNADELPAGPAASEATVGDAKSAESPAGYYQSPAIVAAADDRPSSTVEGAGADGAPSSQASPAANRDEVVEVGGEPEPSPGATDDRWHAVLVGFVDDPRGSVEAARALIDEDIATYLALLAQRKEAMRAAWDASKDADTEALRVTLVSYRDLRKRLADVLDALTP